MTNECDGKPTLAGKLYVCIGCKPIGHATADESGIALARALTQISGSALASVRQVKCLQSCPVPCSIALRGAGKWTIRLSGLTSADATAISKLAEEYVCSPAGEIASDRWPRSLHERVTMLTPPFSIKTV